MSKIVVLFFLCLMMACATPAQLIPTAANPAAQGEMLLKSDDDNGNHILDVEVKYMARPEAIDSRMKTYVVWTRAGGQKEWSNAGQLKINSDREGKMKSPTPYDKLEVLITAEESATALNPSTFVVLKGGVAKD